MKKLNEPLPVINEFPKSEEKNEKEKTQKISRQKNRQQKQIEVSTAQNKSLEEKKPENKHQAVAHIEKYLKISDFVSYILDNKDIFL